MLSSLGTGYADPKHQRYEFTHAPVELKKPLKKQFRLILESGYSERTTNNSSTGTVSNFFNVTVPDGYIQSHAVLAVESFRLIFAGPSALSTDITANGYFKVNSPSFPMAYSYDSASGNQTTTLISVQGRSYQRNADDYIILRDSIFLTSKTIQIDLVASDPTTYTYITPTGAEWILVLTITEV